MTQLLNKSVIELVDEYKETCKELNNSIELNSRSEEKTHVGTLLYQDNLIERKLELFQSIEEQVNGCLNTIEEVSYMSDQDFEIVDRLFRKMLSRLEEL